LNLLQTAWEANRIGRVLELLEETRPGKDEEDLRGFEWHYWNRLCHADLQTWHLSGGSLGRGLGMLSPDGARYAAMIPADGDRPSVVKVWDTATGKELISLPLDDARLGSEHLAFSQDGKRLALAAVVMWIRPALPNYTDNRVMVWELATGKKLLDL